MSADNPDLFDSHIKLSAVVRVNIAVDKDDCSLCSRDCIFYRSVGFAGSPTAEACSAFAPAFQPLDNWLTSRYRDTACVNMFGPFKPKLTLADALSGDTGDDVEGTSCTCGDDTDEECPDHPRMVLKSKPRAKKLGTVKPVESESGNNGDTEGDDVEIDDDLSDAALGLGHSGDEDEAMRPLDENDPILHDHSWHRIQDKAPLPHQIVDVYGIAFSSISRDVTRLLFKRVKVMPCTEDDAKILELTPGTGYGVIMGDRNGATVEIHRWKAAKQRGRVPGSKNKPKQ
jgi:hypothetical protein